MPESLEPKLTFHIIGDAYVDLFCFLEGGLPESGEYRQITGYVDARVPYGPLFECYTIWPGCALLPYSKSCHFYSLSNFDCLGAGGDSRLEQPIRRYAGGSSTNTATHLHALIGHFFHKDPDQQNQTEDSNEKTVDPPANKPLVLLHTVFNASDRFGQILLEHGERQGFEISNCYHPPSEEETSDSSSRSLSTGHCVAIVSGGERSFMTHQGCVGTFSADDLDLPRIIQTKHSIHVHVAGFFNVEGFHHDNLRRALAKIRAERTESTVMSLVTQHDASKQWDGGLAQVAPYLDFLIMNELEANSILNRAGKDVPPSPSSPSDTSSLSLTDDLVKAWVHYFSSWDPTTCVIVTMGPQGAVAFCNHQVVASLLPAVKVDVVDPTGAGDSFTAGFLHGLWEWERENGNQLREPMVTQTSTITPSFQKVSWPAEAVQQGILWGCAVGTSAVTVRGASNPAPPDTIERYFNQQRIRL